MAQLPAGMSDDARIMLVGVLIGAVVAGVIAIVSQLLSFFANLVIERRREQRKTLVPLLKNVDRMIRDLINTYQNFLTGAAFDNQQMRETADTLSKGLIKFLSENELEIPRRCWKRLCYISTKVSEIYVGVVDMSGGAAEALKGKRIIEEEIVPRWAWLRRRARKYLWGPLAR